MEMDGFRRVPDLPQRARLQHHHRHGHDVPRGAGDDRLARRHGGVPRRGRCARSDREASSPAPWRESVFDVDVQGYEIVVYRRESRGMTGGEGAAPVKEVLAFLAREYPGARVLLDHRNPFELLVATVLAAQCTDERVNRVTPGLFRSWPGPAASRRRGRGRSRRRSGPPGSTGTRRRRSGSCRPPSCGRHGGRRPADDGGADRPSRRGPEDRFDPPRRLLRGPRAAGGHARREGLVPPRADRVEGPRADRGGPGRGRSPGRRWWEFTTRLGWHGRKVCAARKPRCAECGLEPVCPKRGLVG